MKLVITLAAGLLAVAAGGASAQTEAPTARPPVDDIANERIDRFSTALVGELLDTLGLLYTVGQGPYGEPAIAVRGTLASDGTGPPMTRFDVQFFGCDDDGRCDEMSLVSRYWPTRPTSLTTVNRFNQGTRFTTAYTGLEGELVLSMDLSAVGGIGRQATMIMIAIYVYNMDGFAQAIGVS